MLYPWVHVSRLKPRTLFPDRPTEDVEVAEDGDFGATILPEDVNSPKEVQDEYEIEPAVALASSFFHFQPYQPRLEDQLAVNTLDFILMKRRGTERHRIGAERHQHQPIQATAMPKAKAWKTVGMDLSPEDAN
ncbi:unnamed protein product [Phytophthora fragariaefolia]|uniref:Unnamed protein product n=1 Tax=Phytophthora fragariaefolia TaxID=1490495 RepID=A0A9W6XSQ3_9STRA|nr:unnamed protein product [Phytophthora fragariaefolia]